MNDSVCRSLLHLCTRHWTPRCVHIHSNSTRLDVCSVQANIRLNAVLLSCSTVCVCTVRASQGAGLVYLQHGFPHHHARVRPCFEAARPERCHHVVEQRFGRCISAVSLAVNTCSLNSSCGVRALVVYCFGPKDERTACVAGCIGQPQRSWRCFFPSSATSSRSLAPSPSSPAASSSLSYSQQSCATKLP